LEAIVTPLTGLIRNPHLFPLAPSQPRLTVETFADPVAGEGEALVTVTAAGLHRIVKALADGSHYGASAEFPFIPGIDGVGRLDDGRRVYFFVARPPFGTMAELCVTRRASVYPLADHLKDAEIAGSANPAMSSWAALTLRAKIAPEESVLILGATGVSGQLAVQIAKRLGAGRVVAAARHLEAMEPLKALGADATIGLDAASFREELKAHKIDIVLDYLWGAPAEAFFEAISQKGLSHTPSRMRYIQIGNSAAPEITLPAAALRSTAIEVLGSGFGSAPMEKLLAAIGDFLVEAARAPFTFRVHGISLAEVGAAWNQPEGGSRIVILPR